MVGAGIQRIKRINTENLHQSETNDGISRPTSTHIEWCTHRIGGSKRAKAPNKEINKDLHQGGGTTEGRNQYRSLITCTFFKHSMDACPLDLEVNYFYKFEPLVGKPAICDREEHCINKSRGGAAGGVRKGDSAGEPQHRIGATSSPKKGVQRKKIQQPVRAKEFDRGKKHDRIDAAAWAISLKAKAPPYNNDAATSVIYTDVTYQPSRAYLSHHSNTQDPFGRRSHTNAVNKQSSVDQKQEEIHGRSTTEDNTELKDVTEPSNTESCRSLFGEIGTEVVSSRSGREKETDYTRKKRRRNAAPSCNTKPCKHAESKGGHTEATAYRHRWSDATNLGFSTELKTTEVIEVGETGKSARIHNKTLTETPKIHIGTAAITTDTLRRTAAITE